MISKQTRVQFRSVAQGGGSTPANARSGISSFVASGGGISGGPAEMLSGAASVDHSADSPGASSSTLQEGSGHASESAQQAPFVDADGQRSAPDGRGMKRERDGFDYQADSAANVLTLRWKGATIVFKSRDAGFSNMSLELYDSARSGCDPRALVDSLKEFGVGEIRRNGRLLSTERLV